MNRVHRQAQYLAFGLIGFALLAILFRLYVQTGELFVLPPLDTVSPFWVLAEDVQSTIRLLITIPIGVIILVIIRQFVGIPTIGTFMPVLIGVAFRDTGLVMGLMMFLGITTLGVAFRFYFERLKLLLVPRLAAILIIVVMGMLALAYLTDVLGLQYGGSVALFPLVILAMMIERLVMAWEELGMKDSLQQIAGSVFIAVLAFLAMTFSPLEAVMFAFPEVLILLLAVAILSGRYFGFRLTEYYRFRNQSSS